MGRLMRIGVQGRNVRVIEVGTGRRVWEGERLDEALRFLDDHWRFQLDYEDRLLCGVAYWHGRWVGGLIKPEWKVLVRDEAPGLVIPQLVHHPLTQRRNWE